MSDVTVAGERRGNYTLEHVGTNRAHLHATYNLFLVITLYISSLFLLVKIYIALHHIMHHIMNYDGCTLK